MVSIKTLPVVATILWLSVAVKDSDYYPPGVSNPNVNQKMYWKDAVNVLQDLDQFESLHILFHGCVYVSFFCSTVPFLGIIVSHILSQHNVW